MERIIQLLDQNSFIEIGAFVKTQEFEFNMQNNAHLGDGVITGYGTIDGRLVFIFSHDPTYLGGSVGQAFGRKIVTIMNLALKAGAPIIGINDSGGARIQEGISSLNAYAEIFQKNVNASGVIPQISLIFGSSAGGAVYSPALTDFIIMVEHTSQMFITGPAVIKTVTGDEITKEGLGGAYIHSTVTGTAHFIAKNEVEAFNLTKRLLSFLPTNNASNAPIFPCIEPVTNILDLDNFIPKDKNRPYSMLKLLTNIIDKDTIMEVSESYAQNIITCFARINGKTVGIVANNPSILAGAIDCDAALKAARFIRFCDSFSIPILTFVDSPGFLPGIHQEHRGIIKDGSKLLYAYSEASIPLITIVIRKGYGGAFVAMNSFPTADVVFAWPTAEIAVLGSEGAVNIIFKRHLGKFENPDNEKIELIKEYEEKFSNPFYAAHRGLISEVIFPSETRSRILASLTMLQSKVQNPILRKHGNIPL
jgi:acetyl-CoA carboxylase carboxyltransferase component